mmetsp:Transcript_23724/g.52067  ORF Transcript_23724/g.52067 Transcript_23724/m.52067 type:complete len:261 (+) Transcript_23724:237-1019(+)
MDRSMPSTLGAPVAASSPVTAMIRWLVLLIESLSVPYSFLRSSILKLSTSFFSFWTSMSSSSWWLVMKTLPSLIFRPFCRSVSRCALALPSRSRFSASTPSSSSSWPDRLPFSFSTNCSFSRTCVKICTVVIVFLRSFSSSSLRSSIFSFKLWFSILSCSKSMRCSPSASSSFCLRVASMRFSWLDKWMFLRRTRCTSSSFSWSSCSSCASRRSEMGLPVLLCSALLATSRRKCLYALLMSSARLMRSSRLLFMSKMVVW